jgi:hypothetical protein
MVRMKWTNSIQKVLSTEGYSDIHVKYRRRTVQFDAPDEWLFVEYWDGSNWNELERYRSETCATTDQACGSGADDNADFKLRFRVIANKNPEFANVDNVEITGVAN